MRFGDLVQPADGYCGLIVGEHKAMLGDGCEEVMDDAAWSQLKVVPINIYQDGGAASNFDSLVEGRPPGQVSGPVVGF